MDALEQREEKMKQRRILSDLLIILVVLLCLVIGAGGFSWHYYYGPCGVKRVETAGLALADQFDAYRDAYDVASATPRVALSGPILQLQDVKRQTQLTPVPTCMDGAKYELVQVIDNGINIFLSFSSSDDLSVDFYMNESASHLAEFRTQLEAVEMCKPYCQVR